MPRFLSFFFSLILLAPAPLSAAAATAVLPAARAFVVPNVTLPPAAVTAAPFRLYQAPPIAPQAAATLPAAGPAEFTTPASPADPQAAPDRQAAGAVSVGTLGGLAADLETSRLSGGDPAASFNRLFDQTGLRNPSTAVEPGAPPAPASAASRYRLKLNRSGLSRGEDVRTFATRRYGDKPGTSALGRLRRLGSGFEELIADPGLVIRIKEFERFVHDQRLGNEDSWAAREKFSAHLGKRVVYRALVLDEKEYREVLKNGMKSTAALKHPPLDENHGRSSLQKTFTAKLYGSTDSPLLSVTELPDVAKAAAFRFLQNDPAGSTKTIRLFTITIPELDVLYPEKTDPERPPVMADPHVGWPMTIYSPHDAHQYIYDRKVESLVLYGIGPEEIVASESIPGDSGSYWYTEPRPN